ncbi:hypothetical protein HNQ56_002952 [Anaerotaenia torta]|uniref:YIP1 family protein n=1 Tax=Anaerotaenia torta TaxID=433293 RepID=UPI003D250E02
MKKFLMDVKYLQYVIFHPFDGFFETKFRGKGSILLATILLLLYGILGIFSTQYTGFIFNFYPTFALDSINLFMTSILPVVLFFISNWSTTTLMNGNGKLKDIYIVACYSLLPLILFKVSTVLLSNVITIEEGPILSAFNYLGVVWFCFLIFTGLCTIHEYSVLKNIVTLLATLAAAIIIIFLLVLYFSLLEKVISFVSTIATEISKRW